MSGLLSADAVVVCKHILGYILVTYCGLLVTHSLTLQSLVKTHVGHNSGNDCIAV